MRLKNNEKGITLIEVLAVFVLLSIVFGIAFSILLNGKRAYQETLDDLSVQQQAHIIIETMRQHHFKNTQYLITLQEEALFVNGEPIRTNYVESIAFNNEPLNEGESIVIETNAALFVDLALKNKKEYYEVRTVLERWN